MSVFDESATLLYPLFEGDFGAPGDKVLNDQIATCKKPATCVECLGPIYPGTRYRRHVGVYDGQLRTYKYCADCCAAMARRFASPNGWKAMEARSKLRAKRLKEAPNV